MEKVLVVDDEIDICILVTKYLESLGIKAEYALTIKDAFAKIAVTHYPLYIIDLNLSDGSGYDLMKRLINPKHDSKIIVITAYDGERKKAMESGADYFAPKPLSKRSIDDALKAVNFNSPTYKS